MNELKEPLSFSDQVHRLKDHGLIVEDEIEAETILSKVNYYRFTGYALQWRLSPSDSNYISGKSFNDVYRIYCFDCELRSILRRYIEIVEVFFRTRISNCFSIRNCKSSPHDQHYLESNYYNKECFNSVIESFSKAEKKYFSDMLVVQHHIAKYNGKMPLWVMVEFFTMTDLSKLYSSMYRNDQIAIATSCGSGSEVSLKNHLHCLSILRNKCAHAAQLYNTTMRPSASFNKQFLRNHKSLNVDSIFAYILLLFKYLDAASKSAFSDELFNLIDSYSSSIDLELIGFPEDYKHMICKLIEK